MFTLQTLKGYDRRKIFDLVKNTGWIFVDKMFRMAASLLVGVWIARYLGPSDFGLLNYVSVFPLLFTAFAGLGLTNILFNEFIVESNPSSFKILLTSSIFIKFIAGVVSFLGIIIVSVYMHTEPLMNILITISATSLIIQSLDVIDVYFQSQRAVKYSVIPKLIVFFIATCFRVFGLWNKAELLFFVAVTALELLLSSLISFAIYTNYTGLTFSDIRIDRTLIKRLLRLSWPLMLSELFLFLYARIDLIMIKQFSTTAELGNYSVTMRITDLWYFIPIAITTSLVPSIINIRQIDYREYLNRYGYLLNMLAAISLTIGLILTLTADPLINFLYGNKYQGVGQILSINIWTGLFVFIAIGSDRWFIVESKQKFVLYRTIAGAFINIALNFTLIPPFGALGASIATLIAQVFASYLINGIYSSTREIFYIQTKAIFFPPLFIGKTIKQLFL